jgi:hypothetical protein
MVTKARTAFFVGVPSAQERELLAIIGESYQVYTLDHASAAYQQMVHVIPDLVVFAANQSNTSALKLFRQLRRLERVSVIVSGTQSIQGFVGKRYQRRRDAPNDPAGCHAILDWLDRFGLSAEFEQSRSLRLRPLTMATVENF